MLAYIKGKLEMKMTGYIVIDVGGLGYKIFMSETGIEICTAHDVKNGALFPGISVCDCGGTLHGSRGLCSVRKGCAGAYCLWRDLSVGEPGKGCLGDFRDGDFGDSIAAHAAGGLLQWRGTPIELFPFQDSRESKVYIFGQFDLWGRGCQRIDDAIFDGG